ncbi:hypothetical protein SBOR_2409 [Sclerotinia borealis F-4128]|uniref:Uncharacterized protein n=1 Tax=Sclerotinia borealis (strain F-4128) TaxID=1432307 RepID=W9CRT9_SCLBF|nr:hypothetical protein SBOR_2409 [Sclerotinia borealis F-4128]
MSALCLQSTGGEAAPQPRDIIQISDDHRNRIKNFEDTLESLPKGFSPLSPMERAERHRLYGDAYRRIIEYYRAGKPLPMNGKCVYTITGQDGVWRDTVIEMMKKARELKGFPVFDLYAIQACHNTETGTSNELGKGPTQAESAAVQMAQSASFNAGLGGNLHPVTNPAHLGF